MIVWTLLLACSGSEGLRAPEGLGATGIVARVRDGAFELQPAGGGEVKVRVDWSRLEVDPVDASDAMLVSSLSGASGLWVDLPPSLPWYRARKLLGSAEAAGVEAVFLSVRGEDEAPLRAGEEPAIGLRMSCREGPLPWSGVQPRVTVALQRSSEGSWAVANARFLPVVDGVPTDGLPRECLAPHGCDDWFAGPEVAACEEGRRAPFDGRVALGGPVGCLLPFVRSPHDLGSWRAELPPVMRGLELQAKDPVLVAPEARIRWDMVMTMLRAFDDAGLPVPALGKPLIEGNDGPPLCTADVKDAAALKVAAARRAGTLMGPPPASPKED